MSQKDKRLAVLFLHSTVHGADIYFILTL